MCSRRPEKVLAGQRDVVGEQPLARRWRPFRSDACRHLHRRPRYFFGRRYSAFWYVCAQLVLSFAFALWPETPDGVVSSIPAGVRIVEVDALAFAVAGGGRGRPPPNSHLRSG